MIQNLTLVVDREPLSGATSGLIYVPITFDCNLQRADIITDQNVTGDVVFSLSKNGVLIDGTTLTVANGTRIEQSAPLDVDLAFGDEVVLNMLSGTLDPPITLNLVVDDGEESGGGATSHGELEDLDADDHPQYFNQARGDARYAQSSTLIETIQDTVGAMLTPGSHALINYNDATGSVSIDSVQLTQEEIQDYIGAFLAGGANTTVTYNDAGNVLTIAETTAGKTSEEIQDIVAGLLAGGANVTLTYDDAGNALTIAASSGGGTSLPSQTGHAGKFLTTDGTNLSWDTIFGINSLYPITDPGAASDYTWVNQQNSTISKVGGSLKAKFNDVSHNTAYYRLLGLVKANSVGAGDWSYTIGVQISHPNPNTSYSASGSRAGILLRDSVTGKSQICGLQCYENSDPFAKQTVKFSNIASDNQTLSAPVGSAAVTNAKFTNWSVYFFRVTQKTSGGGAQFRRFFISPDGITFLQLASIAYNESFTPNQFGFGALIEEGYLEYFMNIFSSQFVLT